MKYETWAYYPESETWKQIDFSESPEFSDFIETPLGSIAIIAGKAYIHQISFVSDHSDHSRSEKTHATQIKNLSNQVCTLAHHQLREYFSGTRTRFSLPLYIHGTPFQCLVWRTLATVPYGTTRSYKELAQLSGNPRAARAIGTVMHNNPLGIVLPCHRIIGANGELVGYYGGLHFKAWLLEHESRHCARSV
ncbi:MAG TPA: methylated-DNA--[protein]-cysteine S-methyltransferase [Spirochaetales bacterium]|nr:methylated-DNA--[protein]-cysteine S-methyltransferase [Spirochaetales bacterium]HQG39263.1 methylated-DNA--[protein]-cysteine S-methyltransferase [Spirochaetales bacterium]HQK35887.1 methylated-DNA--[protein]-cysteine S-methyltransferase [Spirochaetales bacterium]